MVVSPREEGGASGLRVFPPVHRHRPFPGLYHLECLILSNTMSPVKLENNFAYLLGMQANEENTLEINTPYP